MRIGELARRSGTSARSIRYYEQQGLMVARRRPNGYRDYDERSVATVRRIQVLLEYFHGYNPNGQFYRERVDYAGIGLHAYF